MSGYKNTGKTCYRSKREKNSKFKLPFEARHIDKHQYFNDTFINALKFHFFSHDLTVPYPVARKVLYDIWYDALKNSNDKIHKRNIELEYTNYLEYFNERLTQYHDYVRDWEAYRKSELYQETLKTLSEIKRTDHRLQIATDFALAYLYAKYQTRHNYERVITKVEQALHLDVITKLWSKTSFWLAMQLLVFDPSNLYAATIGNNKVYVSEFDKVKEEAIKIYITPWYEREDIKLSQEWRNLAMVYHELIVPLAGEVGSVALAEAARRGTVISLIHLANALTTLATLHPAMRGISTASKILEFAATFLDKSILAWLGWQIGVEWALDGAIQKVLTEFGKYLYTAITGEPVKKGYYLDSELKEISEAVNLYLKLLNGSGYIDGSDIKLAEWYNNASLKLRYLFDKIVKTLEIKEKMYNQLKAAKIKKIDIEDILDKSFIYICSTDENDFVKFLNNTLSTIFESFDRYLDAIFLTKANSAYKDMLITEYNKAKNFLFDESYLSLYEIHKEGRTYDKNLKEKTVYLKRPYVYKEENKAFVAVYVTSSIQNYIDFNRQNVLFISFDIFYTNSDSEPFGKIDIDGAWLGFWIKIYDEYFYRTSIDLYKLITECTDINNLISALNTIDSNINVKIDSKDYQNLVEYISTNKLKLRKQKRCISVIKKLYRKKTKKQPSKEFNFNLTNYTARGIIISTYANVFCKEFSAGSGYYFSTFLLNSYNQIDKQAQYTIAINQYAEKDIARELIFDIGPSLPEIDDVMQIPTVFSYQKNRIRLIDFSKTFTINFDVKKSDIKPKKSKRSKIICFKN